MTIWILKKIRLAKLYVLELQIGHEAHCQDTDIAGGHICLLDWPIANINNSKQLYLVVTFVPHCVVGMLWSINGWCRSNAISNLPTRGSAVASGHRRSQGISEAKRDWCRFRLIWLAKLPKECNYIKFWKQSSSRKIRFLGFWCLLTMNIPFSFSFVLWNLIWQQVVY